jgi:peptide/nickel transport system ATP-binding protein
MTPGEMSRPDAASGLLKVQGLRVQFATARGWLTVVDDVGFSVGPKETVGLVGESGSGKTVSALAIMGLVPPRAGRVAHGSITFDGQLLNGLSPEAMRRLRGDQISMIFQEPMSSLNPAFTVGNQIAETVRLHRGASRRSAWSRAVEMLDVVGIPDPHRRAHDYPHALSGGMRQRAMIAMALACEPKLLIADEPTTALDVTIQAQVLELMRSLQNAMGMAILFVTHDLGVVAEICDHVVVMYAGQVVEQVTTADLFHRPQHPYSQALLESMPQLAAWGNRLRVIPGQVPRPDELPAGCRFHPRCSYADPRCLTTTVMLEPAAGGVGGAVRCLRHAELVLNGAPRAPSGPAGAVAHEPGSRPLLELRGLTKDFPVHSSVLRRLTGRVQAVAGVDLAIAAGQTLGLVGESGSGKSTLARLALRLIEPTAGRIILDGRDITVLSQRALRSARRDMQIVFQDPYSSLDPRATIGEAVAEPLEVHQGLRGRRRDERVAELLERVGLNRAMMRRYPHEFSGGQRQRIAVARALALDPRLLICDEPVSSLDVSTQSQVINLLTDLQDELGLTYLFIAHDLSVVRHISDRIAVMYLGRIVEEGYAEQVYTRPRHPYTLALLSAIPVPDPSATQRKRRIVLEGDVPSPLDPPAGCRFHPRCPYAMDVCTRIEPEPFCTQDGTTVACHLHTSGPTLAGRPLTDAGIPEMAAPTGHNDDAAAFPPRAPAGPAVTDR